MYICIDITPLLLGGGGLARQVAAIVGRAKGIKHAVAEEHHEDVEIAEAQEGVNSKGPRRD